MPEPEVLAFDLYGTLVDPIGISMALTEMTDQKTASEVARLWRQRQLEYSFRLTAMQRYQDFRWVTARALDDTLAVLKVDLDSSERGELIDAYDHLQPFPDAQKGLEELAPRHRIVVFSNGTPAMIHECLANSGLAEFVTLAISVNEVKAFKPSPRVYQHAAAQIGEPIGAIRLISSNPFDVIGSKSAGMLNAWVDRNGTVFDTLADSPDLQVTDLQELGRALDG